MTIKNRLKFKNNDHILRGIELIPLISDIDDIEAPFEWN